MLQMEPDTSVEKCLFQWITDTITRWSDFICIVFKKYILSHFIIFHLTNNKMFGILLSTYQFSLQPGLSIIGFELQ